MTKPIPAAPLFALGRPGLGRGWGVKRVVIQPPATFARLPAENRQERAS